MECHSANESSKEGSKLTATHKRKRKKYGVDPEERG